MKTTSLFDQSMQWLSRTVAIVIIMVTPGLLGMWIDERLDTPLFTPAGFLIGIVLGTTLLLVLAQKFAPPARGKPLPADEEQPASAAHNHSDPQPNQRDTPKTPNNPSARDL